tara:strand:+ start:14245 stop:15759 length:1515 start_codon:yes stop_codon:yes gene_type:complete
MRLIRLTTTNPQAIFDNNFNADIVIPKDAKIALQNLSLETPNSLITITPENNTILYQVGNGGTASITLPLGTFNQSNYEDLFTNITDALNESAGFDLVLNNRRELGIEWRCVKEGDGKVAISYLLGTLLGDPAQQLRNLFVNDGSVRAVSTNNNMYTKSVGLPPSSAYTANVFLRNYISKGCGFIRCRINKLTNNPAEVNSGFAIGLTNKNMLNETNADFESGDATFALRVKLFDKGTASEEYRYVAIRNGVETDTGQPVVQATTNDSNNDYLEILKNAGEIELNYYNNVTGNQKTTLASYPATEGEELFPFMVFFAGSDDAQLNYVRITESPYSNNPTVQGQLPANTEAGLFSPPRPTRNPAPNYLQFGSSSLARYLGYEQIRYPSGSEYNNVIVASYPAEKIFTSTLLSDAFLVILDNIPLDSYDGYVDPATGGLGQRKNILAVVPASNKDKTVIYEPSTPYFIDIKNNSDQLLRNIRARVVNPDYSVLDMEGLATLTILIS